MRVTLRARSRIQVISYASGGPQTLRLYRLFDLAGLCGRVFVCLASHDLPSEHSVPVAKLLMLLKGAYRSWFPLRGTSNDAFCFWIQVSVEFYLYSVSFLRGESTALHFTCWKKLRNRCFYAKISISCWIDVYRSRFLFTCRINRHYSLLNELIKVRFIGAVTN